MTPLPPLMRPTGTERLVLPSGRAVAVAKCTPSFRECSGRRRPLGPTYDSKPLLAFEGEAAFAEIVVLASFLSAGWGGAWIDGFHRAAWRGMPAPETRAEIPTLIAARLERIGAADPRARCWDVVVWRGEEILFCEAKRATRDKIRDSQLRWLDSALVNGVAMSQFLIAEWSAHAGA